MPTKKSFKILDDTYWGERANKSQTADLLFTEESQKFFAVTTYRTGENTIKD